MMNKIFSSLVGLLTVVAPFAGEAYADSFEFLSYTPPSGWTKQVSADKTTYQRKNGIGAIVFYASYPTNGTAADEFARMWRERLEPVLAVKSPQPEIQREGDLTAAVGMQAVNARGTMTTAVMTVLVGHGQAIGVVSLSAGDDVLREVTAFFDSLKVLPQTSASQTNSGSAATGGIEVDYKDPPGLTAKNDGQMILLSPPQLNANSPCAYWISPPRPSKGSLEADARAAVSELPIQGQISTDRYNAMRGTAPDGWTYFLFGSDIRNSAGTSIAYAMALAFPAGAGQVNIVLGIGNGGSNCYMHDGNFVHLFHSLNPRSWTPDGGKSFAKELMGLWRSTSGGTFSNSNNFYLGQYKFMENGQYASGRGGITVTGNLETTTAVASDGSYKISGNSLTLTSNSSHNVFKFHARVYDDYVAGRWWRKMSLYNEEIKMEVDYDRIEN